MPGSEGSALDVESQYDFLGAVHLQANDNKTSTMTPVFKRIRLTNRDPQAEQVLQALIDLFSKYNDTTRFYIALDAPL